MSTLHKLAMAFVAVVGGVEVVVLDAVPSPVHDDLMVAETLTVGALVIGAGVALWLAAAFGAGQSGPQRRVEGTAAPYGVPPWETAAGNMQTRPPTIVTEPIRAPEAPVAVTPAEHRNARLADAWRRWDTTGEQTALSDDTQIMTFDVLAEDDETFPTLIDAAQAYGIAPTRIVRADAASLPPSEREYPERAPVTVWDVKPEALAGQGATLRLWFGDAFERRAA